MQSSRQPFLQFGRFPAPMQKKQFTPALPHHNAAHAIDSCGKSLIGGWEGAGHTH
jgi:hypothetical protein